MNSQRNTLARVGVVLVTVAAAMLSGCTRDPNLPTEEMKRAQSAIENAEKAGAQRYAMADLQQAKAAYQLADDARHQGNTDASRVHAMEAATLAARAATLASSGETQRADAAVQRSADVAEEASDMGAADAGHTDAAYTPIAGASGSSQTQQ